MKKLQQTFQDDKKTEQNKKQKTKEMETLKFCFHF